VLLPELGDEAEETARHVSQLALSCFAILL
jgi:hypothetical protein